MGVGVGHAGCPGQCTAGRPRDEGMQLKTLPKQQMHAPSPALDAVPVPARAAKQRLEGSVCVFEGLIVQCCAGNRSAYSFKPMCASRRANLPCCAMALATLHCTSPVRLSAKLLSCAPLAPARHCITPCPASRVCRQLMQPQLVLVAGAPASSPWWRSCLLCRRLQGAAVRPASPPAQCHLAQGPEKMASPTALPVHS